MKTVLILCFLVGFCSCSGGGEDKCDKSTPLYCQRTRACCGAGLPYACDGFCYSVPVTGCANSEICVFKKGEAFEEILKNLDPNQPPKPSQEMSIKTN